MPELADANEVKDIPKVESTSKPCDKTIVPKEYILPFILLTICFALWGAANNMTDFMVPVFKQVKEMTNFHASIIQFAFYGAYFVLAIPAAIMIQRASYKTGVIVGLIIYAMGAFLCFPASKVDSFSFFLLAYFVYASGCAILETCVAPYVISMGPESTATQRINLAQALNPVGSVLGIYLGKKVILENLTPAETYKSLEGAAKSVAEAQDLSFVVKAYMLVGLVGLIVCAIIFVTKFPKKSAEKTGGVGDAFGRLFKNKNYVFSVIAQFFYVGCQIGIWTNVTAYVINAKIGVTEQNDAWWFYLYSLCAFLASRFVFTFLMKFIDPARLLSFAAIVASVLTTVVIFTTGHVGVYSLVATSAFMSLMFPTIYGLGLLGLDDNDRKVGGSGIIMAIVGGAVLVPTQGFLADKFGVSASFAMPLVCFILVAVYGFVAHQKEEESGIA